MSLNFKNEVQLRGILKTIQPLPRGRKTMYLLRVETQRAYNDREGVAQIKKDIHPVTAWPGRHIPEDDLKRLRPGNVVFIKGHNAYEPQFHVFAESVTLSRSTASTVATPIKI